MSAGHHRLGPGLSVLLKAQMGWVLGGSVRSTTASQRRIRNVVTNKPLNDQLTRFWVIETIPETNESYTQSYEGYFMQMITRNFGRHLIVEISLNYDITKSEHTALGHTYKLPRNSPIKTKPVYYLPHHVVIKETSTITKERVLFDGSTKTSKKMSLNEV
ncbi:uncharacterized protein LOC105666974 [Bombus terrestris]|uniref:Uncharacterized protein LOC105666974 n=1 Tax=Bombus terrestris TaxID=30195 RepID=A0A9B2MS42_BOMTE|nr:uncharacterized protein LOC105666974 [Bombus terrestris]